MEGVTQRLIWEAAALALVANWMEGPWEARIPDRVWDALHEEGYLHTIAMHGDERVPALTEKGESYLRELLAADK